MEKESLPAVGPDRLEGARAARVDEGVGSCVSDDGEGLGLVRGGRPRGDDLGDVPSIIPRDSQHYPRRQCSVQWVWENVSAATEFLLNNVFQNMNMTHF